jgi:hypothetical protein
MAATFEGSHEDDGTNFAALLLEMFNARLITNAQHYVVRYCRMN